MWKIRVIWTNGTYDRIYLVEEEVVDMDEIDIQILEKLAQEKSSTSSELATKFSLSSRTIRNRLRQISNELNDDIAKMESKAGIGFSIDIIDEKSFNEFIIEKKELNNINPQTKEGRINFIIDYLLLNDNYVNLNKLSELLFVSRSTLSNDMLKVKSFFEPYHLTVENHKKKGVKLTGKEKDIRQCLSQINDKNNLFELFGGHERYVKIKEILNQVLTEYTISLSDLGFQNLCNHLYILVERNKSKNYQEATEFNDLDLVLDDYLLKAAKKISSKVNKTFEIDLSLGETDYIAIHLGGKQYLALSNYDHDIFEDLNTHTVVIQFLEAVYYDWNIDLRSDDKLIFNLILHFKPMAIRLISGFEQKNPMLEDIKNHLSFAYLLTSQSIHIVENELETEISSDEISFISLHINLSLKRKIENKNKKNVLILCDTGMTSSQMLASIITDRFNKYINKITTNQINNLSKVDLSEFDLIITTTETSFETDIPTIKVNYFLDEVDIELIKKYLIPSEFKSIEEYFDEDLFIKFTNVQNKEQIISKMVDQIKIDHDIPDNFYHLILEREAVGSTDFRNYIALPHPKELVTDNTIVSVGVLDQPIIWNTEEVQVVILVSVQKQFSTELNLFYKVMSKFMASEVEVNKLIEHKDYQKFIKQIKQIEKKEGK